VNCDSLHRRLLTLEHPDRPPDEVREHLAACPACRDWHQRLLQMERRAATLPVPPPRRKTAFLERLVKEGEEKKPAEPRPGLLPFLRPGPLGSRERAMQKIAVSVAMAAALLLVALGIWAFQGGGPPPGNPGLEQIDKRYSLKHRLEQDPRWSEDKPAAQRLEVLSDLAEEVRSAAQAAARTGFAPGRRVEARATTATDLEKEVRLFKDIVERITATEALQVDPGERAQILKPLADRFAVAESQARQLAMEVPSAAAPLRELAAAAGEGNRQLRTLLHAA
jgi:hypothetical protein